MTTPYLSETKNSVQLKVYAQPNAKKTEIVGIHNEALKIKIKAVPEDGKANDELCLFVAKKLGLNKSQVEILRGQTSRSKVLTIVGIELKKAQDVLAPPIWHEP